MVTSRHPILRRPSAFGPPSPFTGRPSASGGGRGRFGRCPTWGARWLGLALALAAAPAGLSAQEIYQAVVLDLTDLGVHVTVARARGDEEVRCLLRDAAGRVRVAGTMPITAGLASGGTTILTIPLPLLDPQEREFAVTLVRRGQELHRTGWRPIFRSR
jgi:hypothetical protein